MPDNLFVAYQARGVKDRAQLVITKADRDAHPLQCGSSEQFIKDSSYDYSSDEVHLSGFAAVQQQSGPQQQNAQQR
jgi:hypothetical protein